MSIRSMSVPKRISDSQFIGDLMNLFERRKIKLGDPGSLENFGADLASNDALRSDLFTLCTAISHMADTDLSGEQLLVLVARALGGPRITKDDGTVEIPESMRSAFLTGYEVWSSRGSELTEPLSWPPARPVRSSEAQPSTQPPDAASDPIAPKLAARGMRTVQEALDIARERTPFDTPAHRSSDPGTNIEGLTLSQLKKLLEDIEHRVSRIEPQLRQLDPAAKPSTDEVKRQERAHASSELQPTKAVVRVGVPAAKPATLPDAAPAGDAAASPASSDMPGATGAPELPRVEVNEAAFFARHVYLQPARRPGTAAQAAQVATKPGSSPAKATKAARAQPAPVLPVRRYRYYGDRDHRRMGIGVVACLILFAVGYAGVYVYHDLNPEDVYAFPDVKPADPSSTSTVTPASAQSPQSLAAPAQSPQSSAAESTANSSKVAADGAANGAVTPASDRVAYDASSMRRSLGVSNATSSHPAASPASPVYVPSSKMMGYALAAPRPVYPNDPARVMDDAVVLQVTISKQGNVISIRTVSGPMEMRTAAVQAVRTWHFKPYLVNGNPTQVVTTLELPFKG